MTCKLKHLFAIIVVLLSAQFASAQAKRTCGTIDHMNYLKSQDPTLENRLKQAELIAEKWIAKHPLNNAANKINTAPDTIPVVVHVVYNTAAENISDAQVQSQVQILNDDFARLNADTVNTPAPFKPIAGGIPYRFVFARRDPNGNPTNGIVRTQTSSTSFTTDDKVKFNAQGGDDAWNTTVYLNIWVCNLGGTLLGYGEFPTGSVSNTYGFVCNYTAFGNQGTATAPYNLGRTTTHEIGHCFNLYHVWGDDGGACTGSDSVADTPNQASETYGNPAWPVTDACTSTSPGIMFMDYMDYTDDAAMNMFTQGQIVRIVAAINSFYPTIVNSIGLQPVVLASLDAGSFANVSPTGAFCASSITPQVTIKNWGLTTLTAVTINYSVDNTSWQQYSWTGSLASLATATITLPSITVASGNHQFISATSSPNGGVDLNSTNDTITTAFSLLSTGQLPPLAQGFEGATFPAAGYQIINPDNSTTWVQATGVSHSGANSMSIDNYNYNASGQTDDLVLPGVDLTNAINPTLTFWEAYQLYTSPSANPNYSDTLQVLISTDCGVTYTSIYKKYSTALTTTTPTFSTTQFVPTSSQWRQETVNLSSYTGSGLAILKFRNITNYENMLYVDDININTTTGINYLNGTKNIAVYPNPSKGIFHVQLNGFNSQVVTVEVVNQLGEVVYQSQTNENNIHQMDVDLSKNQNGLYLIKVVSQGNEYHQRILLNK